MPLEAHLPENRAAFLNKQLLHWGEQAKRSSAVLDLLNRAEKECLAMPQKGEREGLLVKFYDLRVHLEWQIMNAQKQETAINKRLVQ